MSTDPAHLRPYLSHWLRARIGSAELRPGAVFTCQATVLYADLRGFTRLTAAFATLPDGAERLHTALNRCYTVLIETVAAYGGDVSAIAGDALTAWWPNQADVVLAQRCAMALLEAVNALPPLATPSGPFRFYLRIGIGAGMIHAILAGLPHYGVHLTLLGPALLAAATAERAACTGQVVVASPPAMTAERTRFQPGEPGPPLRDDDFLPRALIERLRRQTLTAEYRTCIPVFAGFALPAHPRGLHTLVSQVQETTWRWGGWLNEIEVGNKGAVLVLLFGGPLGRGADASQAVGCCLELRERGLITHAGITQGLLYLGTVGGAERRVYTAQGDEMNLAAHLMQHANSGEILVSGRVRSEVQGRYLTSEPILLATKGHQEGVPVARVLGAAGEPAP
ncbi:MAG: adenylate/guanylate cyclase domain-containing protein [Oscillochloridaceae bacterium]|nr:adenylate/guanylate cyclase domain-containing protein [Chloroflexaceae bacterium]MDW8392274.1 adenylate/guanylate cyclase domain-containing protein [Oscillochloridaceae bacterium]